MTEVTGSTRAGSAIVTADGPIAYDYLILAVGGQRTTSGLEACRGEDEVVIGDRPSAVTMRFPLASRPVTSVIRNSALD